MELTPAKNIIIVKQREAPKQSAGGIMLPDSAKQPNSDKVVDVLDVGSEVEGVKAGDVCVISPYNIVVAVIEGNTYGFITIENVLAKLS